MKISAFTINVKLTGTPINGSPTFKRENVIAPTSALETLDFIPPDKGIPPRIKAIITFNSYHVPVESDAEAVYPI